MSGHLDLTHNLQVKLLSFVVSFFSLTIIPQITYFKIGDADRTKQELDKVKEARNKAMEKVSETNRKKNDGSEVEPKRRRSGSETVQYLHEKSEREASIKEREFELQKRKQEEERKHHKGLLLLMQQQQQQQQQQLQIMLSQQNQIMITLLEKFASKS